MGDYKTRRMGTHNSTLPRSTMVLLLLLLASLTSAEFLTPVHEHDNGKLPDLCHQDTVMSCDLVQIDIASLHNAALDFRGTTLNSWTSLARTPSPSLLRMGTRPPSP